MRAGCSAERARLLRGTRIGVTERDIGRLCQQMKAKDSSVSFVYEAEPCGYGLQRQLARKGLSCVVCTLSLIARKPRDRVKIDRRARPRPARPDAATPADPVA